MPRLEPYSKDLSYSYALGLYPALTLMERRPETVTRLLLNGNVPDGEGINKLRERCAAKGIREECAEKVLKRESGKANCFAALVFNKYSGSLNDGQPHIVLNQISDAGNLGTILRSAVAFGYGNIAVIRPCVDVFEPHTIRASMGAMFFLELAIYDSFEEYRSAYPGHELYPFMLDGAVNLQRAALKAGSRHALVFGNEARGLEARFAALGQSVKIPQSDEIDSLNLSVAASIAMYTFRNIKKDQ